MNREKGTGFGRRRYTISEVRESGQAVQEWWTHFVIAPISDWLTWVVANYTRLTPNLVTLLTVPTTALVVFFFLRGERVDMVIGAVAFEINFAIDCVDGKLARLTGRTSRVGTFLDPYLDTWRNVACLSALVWGQYASTGDARLVVVAWAYLVMNVSSTLMKYIGREVLGADFRREFLLSDRQYRGPDRIKRLRGWLARHHLTPIFFTTVEGEAFVFFFGPITGHVLESIAIATLLILFFYMAKSVFFFYSCMRADRRG